MSRFVLLVEGSNDEHVLYSLLVHHNVPRSFSVINKRGVNNILETLDVEIDRSGLERLGIILDADENVSARWQSLRDRLDDIGYMDIPFAPDINGTTITQDGRPIIGIWLMPDTTIPGMLEDFVSQLIPSREINVLWRMVEDTFTRLPAQDELSPGERRFSDNATIKAEIHTWLAWQEEPGKPLGQAITARYFDAGSPYTARLMTWLQDLFVVL